MTSRDEILRTVRECSVERVDLPALDGPWIEYADRRAQFTTCMQAVGGRVAFLGSLAEVNAELRKRPEHADATKVLCTVSGVGHSNSLVDWASIKDPQELEDVDVAILPGKLAVAENAAVWVTAEGLGHRVAYFICQHLVLVLPANCIVDNMHQAYEKLGRRFFDRAGFGVFISGPSKTADIEQSLVIGAHGPRSLSVFFVEEEV
jgi:L-lactate dehydrogenase complex protein LldG